MIAPTRVQHNLQYFDTLQNCESNMDSQFFQFM